ncbi:MAG: hypothetical protein ABI321_02855 [Polyangia bacterium]
MERTPSGSLDSMPIAPALGAAASLADECDAPGASAALLLLCVTYVFNFLDRALIFILFPLIKVEMKLSSAICSTSPGTRR